MVVANCTTWAVWFTTSTAKETRKAPPPKVARRRIVLAMRRHPRGGWEFKSSQMTRGRRGTPRLDGPGVMARRHGGLSGYSLPEPGYSAVLGGKHRRPHHIARNRLGALR